MSKRVHCGYCHITPGRLRVRVSGIKQNREAARSLELLMLSQPGITSVRANPVTGNVLVVFEPDATSHEFVLQSLADLGHFPVISETREHSAPEIEDALATLGLNIGVSIAKVALKQALKGSPAAIILELI